MKAVVVGGGPAGQHAALAIRAADAKAQVVVFQSQPDGAIFRPSLGAYVRGCIDRDDLPSLPDGTLAQADIQVVNQPVTRVDLGRRTVTSADDRETSFDRLLLACGTHQPEAATNGPGPLLSLADAERWRAGTDAGGHWLVVGDGIYALTLCYLLRQQRREVTLLVPGSLFLPDWLDSRASQMIYRRLVDDGVTVHLQTSVASQTQPQGRRVVTTSSGKRLTCDGLIDGAEPRPNLTLAEEAGMALKQGGICVSDRLETGVAGVYAAGDLVRVWDKLQGKHVPAGGWMAAVAQGRVAGHNMAAGHPRGPDIYFSMAEYYRSGLVYDLPLALIGRAQAAGDAEVTSAPSAEGYRRLVFKDGRLFSAVLLGDQRHSTLLARIAALQIDVRGYELQLLRTDIDLNHLLRPSREYHLY